MRTAEVLIIGGGVIGASVAYHLAAMGCTDVLVVDRGNTPGAGSTGKATGGFRCQFATEVNVRLSLLSRQKLLQFKEVTGVNSGYDQSGYLFLARHERELIALREAQRVQHACGVTGAIEVTPEDILRLNPAVSMDGIIGGVFCDLDGFITPMNIHRGYMEAAERLGVRFEFGVDCTSFSGSPGNLTEVQTSTGAVSAGAIVNAAGPWAGQLGTLMGIRLPVVPLRRQIAPLRGRGLLPAEMPMTIFVEDGFHCRVRDGRILILLPTVQSSNDPFHIGVDPSWIEHVHAVAKKRFAVLRDTSIDASECWAGLYEMSPDNHVILGRATEVGNVFLANGSSGHGVMHSPALGELLAEVMLTGYPSAFDISALRPSRFEEGELNPASEFL